MISVRKPRAKPAVAGRRHFRKVPRNVWKVLCQAKHDLIGKEVQTGFTASYSWLADQGGHILLGFLGTELLAALIYAIISGASYFISGRWLPVDGLWWWLAIGGVLFAAGALLKEIKDVRLDFRAADVNPLFPLNRPSILWNALTATLIMWFGVAIGLGFLFGLIAGLIVALGGLLLTALFAVWWIPPKVAWQNAGLPFVFRLGHVSSQIEIWKEAGGVYQPALMDEKDGKAIAAFSRPEPTTQQLCHLIVHGANNVGKSSFGVAVGTEFAFGRGYARYVTFARLIDELYSGNVVPIPHQGRLLWPLANVDLLIVDDVDATSAKDKLERKLEEIYAPAMAQSTDRKRDEAVITQTDAATLAKRLESAFPDAAEVSDFGPRRTVWIVSERSTPREWGEHLGALLRSYSLHYKHTPNAEAWVLALTPGPPVAPPTICFPTPVNPTPKTSC